MGCRIPLYEQFQNNLRRFYEDLPGNFNQVYWGGGSKSAGDVLKFFNELLNSLGADTGKVGHAIDTADTDASNDLEKAGKFFWSVVPMLGGGGESKEASQLHHIASDKAIVSGFTEAFERIFAKAGMKLSSEENKMLMSVVDHNGRHGGGYNPYVLEKLTVATKGLEGTEYRNALLRAVRALRTEIKENPSILKMKK